MVPRNHLGLLQVILVVCIPQEGISLDLRGSAVRTTQSSTESIQPAPAEYAIDRNLDTFSHTGWTDPSHRVNPWWKVDLGAIYCIRKITLVNRIGSSAHVAFRLRGNVIRAGMSPDHLRNPEIGRVRDDQAVVGAVVEFTPYPFLTARYVSVDIPRSGEVDGVQTIVQLTEVMVEEVVMETEMDSKSAVLEALNSTNRTISQSSTYNQSGDERVASRAFDGASYYGNPYCSQTNEEPNPWWKIDLGSAYCISKISIRNIDDLRHYTRLNLTGAVARAGLSATPTDNAMCGSPVTQYQALINDRIDIHCEPTKLARYVSVDIPRRSFLILYEVKVWSCELQPPALTLTDNPIFQSSVLSGHDADRALDGLPEDPFCSLTNKEENPWWRVDLQSDNCLGIIRVRNTGSPSEQNLLSAVARAGLSEVPTDNIMCGTPVTSDQSTINDWIEFACDLPVLARYVSVDIPGIGSLKLCEVTVSTCNLQLKHNAADFTLIVNPALLGVSGDDSASITAYKDADDVTAGVTFGRRLPTGENSNDLPSGAVVLADPSTGCADKFVLRLPEEGGLKRTGVFYSERIKNDIRIRIETIILPKDDSYVHIRPAQPTQTASIGDNVKLEMHNVNSPNIYYRWRHNGGDIIVSWNDRLTVAIPAATKENEGVYTCFSSDQEDKQLHGITKLIVRGCVAERWGAPLCLATCRRCYNGGVCDEKSGMCVCAPGFSGDNCEQVHGRHVFGKTAHQRCSNSTDPHHDACRGRLFCLPDPYGCSCAAGYQGLDCMQECREGTFGANCKQTCHCASGGTCSKDTGECTNGCEPPHFGTNCQCSTENGVLGLDVTSGDPHQLFITFQPDACASDYELRHQCEDIASVHRVPQTFNYFLTGIESPSNYIVQVRPIYIGGVRGPEVSHLQPSIPKEPPTRVNLTLATPYSLSFSWSKPPCGSRGGIITGYTYKLTEISPESQVVMQSVTSEESVTIEGLTPLTEYSFQVAANTIAGAGPFSRVAMEATVDAGLSLAVVVGVPATIVILILLIIVTLAVYKRRRRRQNRSPGIDGDTSSHQANNTAEPECTLEPAVYENAIVECTLEPAVYDSASVDYVNTAGFTAALPHQKEKLQPESATHVHAFTNKSEVEMSAQSCLRVGSPKPKPRRLHPQPPAERDTNEQLIQKLLSQLSSVAVDELAEYICKKEQAGQNGFPADFKTLPDGRPCPATVAKKPQNKTKNFSAEIIAYDHSRVVLEALKNDPHSDYINACYIDGILEKDKYIATQGPTSSTVGDFWRMVWQLKVDKIIMLTNLTEGGEVKCHQYWPDTGFATYLNIAVNVIKEDVFPDYKVRDFQIAQVFSEDKNRVVKQFHFTAWPDLQPPEDPSNLLHFVRKVNAKRNNGGTIVHCSNGIGRTGTYIALDSMLDQMQKERRVDVLGFIYRMRQKRTKMVQTPAQYRFIFDALLAAFNADDALN